MATKSAATLLRNAQRELAEAYTKLGAIYCDTKGELTGPLRAEIRRLEAWIDDLRNELAD